MRDLTKTYGNFTALNEITLSIHEGEIFCILGHNGAGKTTMINMLVGLDSQTKGSLFYNNIEMNSANIHKSVGFCSQVDNGIKEISVYENLKFFAKIKGVPSDEVESEVNTVMHKLNLTLYRDSLVHKMSAGWRRKVSFAIALLNNPKIIIMDEPSSGMDRISRNLFWDLVKTLKQEKKTIIFTTQFLDEAEGLSDRIAVLSRGKLFAVGSVEYIKTKFCVGYTLILYNRNNPNNLQHQATEIASLIKDITPSAYCHNDTALNIIKYILPFEEQSKFSTLFSKLESIQDVKV